MICRQHMAEHKRTTKPQIQVESTNVSQYNKQWAEDSIFDIIYFSLNQIRIKLFRLIYQILIKRNLREIVPPDLLKTYNTKSA